MVDVRESVGPGKTIVCRVRMDDIVHGETGSRHVVDIVLGEIVADETHDTAFTVIAGVKRYVVMWAIQF